MAIPPLLVLLAVVAFADEAGETGKWRHHRTETALETVDYLLLDAEVEDRIWTLARRCDLEQAWIQSSVSELGEALDYSLSYLEYRDDEWVRLYDTRLRQDEKQIEDWTWRYGYSADLGIEFLTLKYPTNIDKLLFGDRFAMEISPARGVAVFETTGFGEAFNTHCPSEQRRSWTQSPSSLVGTHFKRGDVRPIPPRENQTGTLTARVAVANRNDRDGLALHVLDPFDWHDVTVAIRAVDGDLWIFKWPGFEGRGMKKTAHIPFEHFRHVGVRRYWRAGHDEIRSIVIVAFIPLTWDKEAGARATWWKVGEGYRTAEEEFRRYEETAANVVIRSPIPTVTWEDASMWPQE